MEFVRNKETGILEVWDRGEKVGEVITMGDIMPLREAGNKNGSRNRNEN